MTKSISPIKFIDTFTLLVDKGADINSQDESDFSVLHHAVFRNNYEAVSRLLDFPTIIIDVCKYLYK